jgi:NTE family protein
MSSFALAPTVARPEAAAAVSRDVPRADAAPTIGIALGGGGANGLAHISMLEVIDEMGIELHRVAGTSIGAIIGALYASGMSGADIRALVEGFILSSGDNVLERIVSEDALRWVDFIEVELGHGGLLSADGFLSFMYEKLHEQRFEALAIPLKVTAADLWSREPVVLESGDLLSAIKASMALPGVFEPVELDGRVLVDGGTVNPVPYDLLMDDCDIVIAIDVTGERTRPESGETGYFETLFNSVKVMQAAIMQEKLRQRAPDIYLSPPIVDVRALEFYRAEEVFRQAEPTRRELKQRLSSLLAA